MSLEQLSKIIEPVSLYTIYSFYTFYTFLHPCKNVKNVKNDKNCYFTPKKIDHNLTFTHKNLEKSRGGVNLQVEQIKNNKLWRA